MLARVFSGPISAAVVLLLVTIAAATTSLAPGQQIVVRLPTRTYGKFFVQDFHLNSSAPVSISFFVEPGQYMPSRHSPVTFDNVTEFNYTWAGPWEAPAIMLGCARPEDFVTVTLTNYGSFTADLVAPSSCDYSANLTKWAMENDAYCGSYSVIYDICRRPFTHHGKKWGPSITLFLMIVSLLILLFAGCGILLGLIIYRCCSRAKVIVYPHQEA